MKGLVHGLQGNMADPITYPRGDRLDAEVVTAPDGLEQRDAGGRHPQAGAAQLLGGGRSLGGGHGVKPTFIDANDSRKGMIQA